MKFGIRQLFEKTPKAMVILGHTLLTTAGTAATYSVVTQSAQYSPLVAIFGIAGTLLTSLFGESKKKF